ncbi:MAG: DUF2852 domain-containing protein [Roseovarius sp.]|uniref:DUF2852 domain-containing protein n=1 Tax=Roseovarius sp. TaxID=1486281 RepID=UPI0032ECA244
MTTATLDAAPTHRGNWLRRSELWLDERGKLAWIAAMVLGFIVFWPIGLALLAYMIWSKRMFNGACATRTRHAHSAFKSSGNTAFDAYKSDTLRRLEEEQDAFERFLNRLRDAKDKAEFDQFMEDRARKKTQSDVDGDTVDA